MEKKNLQPQQQKPVVRPTVAKPIAGLSEEQLTASWTGASGAITPTGCTGWGDNFWPFAGDDAD